MVSLCFFLSLFPFIPVLCSPLTPWVPHTPPTNPNNNHHQIPSNCPPRVCATTKPTSTTTTISTTTPTTTTNPSHYINARGLPNDTPSNTVRAQHRSPTSCSYPRPIKTLLTFRIVSHLRLLQCQHQDVRPRGLHAGAGNHRKRCQAVWELNVKHIMCYSINSCLQTLPGSTRRGPATAMAAQGHQIAHLQRSHVRGQTSERVSKMIICSGFVKQN